MQNIYWRGRVLPFLCLAVFACGKSEVDSKNDPNKPAVVKVAPPVLASDTAKKIVPPVVDPDAAKLKVSSAYSLMGASLSFEDARTLMSNYAPTAELTTSDSAFKGSRAIATMYARLAAGKRLKAFDRASRAFHLIDSTVIDSGLYKIVLKKSAASNDSLVETGTYATEWRIHPEPMLWVITKDHLVRGAAKKPK